MATKQTAHDTEAFLKLNAGIIRAGMKIEEEYKREDGLIATRRFHVAGKHRPTLPGQQQWSDGWVILCGSIHRLIFPEDMPHYFVLE